MSECSITCPHCGMKLYIEINGAGDIALRHFDIDGSEYIELIKNSGYEFGSNRIERGCVSDE